MMSEQCPDVIKSYTRVIKKIDNNKIPFSLRQNLKLASVKNIEVENIYKIFKKGSNIFNAINTDK